HHDQPGPAPGCRYAIRCPPHNLARQSHTKRTPWTNLPGNAATKQVESARLNSLVHEHDPVSPDQRLPTKRTPQTNNTTTKHREPTQPSNSGHEHDPAQP